MKPEQDLRDHPLDSDASSRLRTRGLAFWRTKLGQRKDAVIRGESDHEPAVGPRLEELEETGEAFVDPAQRVLGFVAEGAVEVTDDVVPREAHRQ